MISSILFCCTLNSMRSPMAEALTKNLCGVSVYVDSVGVECGNLDGFMVAVMQEIGIDMQQHKPKKFDMLEDDFFEIIIALSKPAYDKVLLMAKNSDCQLLFWDMFDPSEDIGEKNREENLKHYRVLRDMLLEKIQTLFSSSSIAR